MSNEETINKNAKKAKWYSIISAVIVLIKTILDIVMK